MNKGHNTNRKTATLTAVNPVTGSQVTACLYGTTISGTGLETSAIARNDLLVAVLYPDATDATDSVQMQYNLQSQVAQMQDQNGNVHQYLRDQLGRQTSDQVATLGAGVDGTVRRIDTAYEIRGMVSSVKSYNAASGGTLVNQVLLSYNDFAQLASEIQDPTGAGSGSLYLTVLYGYADGSANTIAISTMTYPNGRVLNYNITATDDIALNRVTSLQFTGDSAAAAAYAYFGLGSVASVTYGTSPAVVCTLAGGSSYPGFDIFGRVIDVPWTSTAGTLANLGYGYDLASNRIYRRDAKAATGFDELYDYDGIERLIDMARGTLTNATSAPAAPITSGTLQQSWNLDATGNWSGFSNFGPTLSSASTLVQQRTSNTANEIIDMAATLGGVWAAPAYDRNGNMTAMPQPNAPTTTYATTVDAWNRLMTVSSGSTVQTNAYDGLNRRTLSLVSGVTTYFYYSNQWQVLEERLSSATSNPSYQYVWGLRYIDDLARRDTFSSSSVSLNLYALQDANWNVVAICNDTGTVLERFVYTPYGVCTFLNPDFSAYTGADYNWTVLYTGRTLDSVTGLYYYRERYLNALLGLFINRDPDGDSGRTNPYEYSNSSPIDLADPMGLEAVCAGSCNVDSPGAIKGVECERECRNKYRVTIDQCNASAKSLLHQCYNDSANAYVAAKITLQTSRTVCANNGQTAYDICFGNYKTDLDKALITLRKCLAVAGSGLAGGVGVSEMQKDPRLYLTTTLVTVDVVVWTCFLTFSSDQFAAIAAYDNCRTTARTNYRGCLTNAQTAYGGSIAIAKQKRQGCEQAALNALSKCRDAAFDKYDDCVESCCD